MFGWKKDSDWLPVADAQAQVDFYTQDLKYSEDYLKYVVSFSNKKWPNYRKMYLIALQDVKDSKTRLAVVEFKLKEAIELNNKTPHS